MVTADKSHMLLTFHRVVLAIFLFSIYYDFKYTFPPSGSRDKYTRESLGGRFKFLTFINAAIFQTGYFAIALVNDYLGTNHENPSKQSNLQKFRDWSFTTILIPASFFVCSMFWGIFAIDRDLIYPPINDTWMPKWLNNVYHTLPVITVLLELVFVNHRFQKGVRKYVPIFFVYLLYTLWGLYIVYKIDFWIYPLFEAFSIPLRLVLIALLCLPFLLFTYAGENIHKLLWGQRTLNQEKDTNKTENSDKQAKENRKKNKDTKSGKSSNLNGQVGGGSKQIAAHRNKENQNNEKVTNAKKKGDSKQTQTIKTKQGKAQTQKQINKNKIS